MTQQTSPRRIERLLDVYPSFALLAGLQLDLFTRLDAGPLPLEGLAAALNVAARRLRPLVYALAAIDLLEVRPGPDGEDAFGNGPEARDFLVAGKPGYMGGMQSLYAQLWAGGLQAGASIRAGRPLAAHDVATMDRETLEAFVQGLHPDALAVGAALARRPEWAGCSRVLDVGGGSGGVAIALAQAHPSLQATVLEQVAVRPLTQRVVSAAGLAGRIAVRVEDPLQGPPQGCHGAAIFKSFLQVLGPEDARRALVHVATAVKPGGHIYIMGQGLIDDSRLQPQAAVVANIVFPSFYAEGQAYTEGEYRAWLAAAGCGSVERVQLDGAPLLIARKDA